MKSEIMVSCALVLKSDRHRKGLRNVQSGLSSGVWFQLAGVL
jgi:hypothetical protein